MCTQRNETDVAVSFTSGLVIGTNDTKACIFTGCSGIGLKAHGMETSDLAKIVFEFLK